ncbi:hypothetical protein BJ878DRAFT_476838 [Calycina marina]|uniref:Uncharacterized protein n=1 Tax=Calycina marina TaxID=1763456 RepID=A0A9P8CI79_9HELO|nr:hypothetical protein BJ878DRAFT_476838 [Calycina marina]
MAISGLIFKKQASLELELNSIRSYTYEAVVENLFDSTSSSPPSFSRFDTSVSVSTNLLPLTPYSNSKSNSLKLRPLDSSSRMYIQAKHDAAQTQPASGPRLRPEEWISQGVCSVPIRPLVLAFNEAGVIRRGDELADDPAYIDKRSDKRPHRNRIEVRSSIHAYEALEETLGNTLKSITDQEHRQAACAEEDQDADHHGSERPQHRITVADPVTHDFREPEARDTADGAAVGEEDVTVEVAYIARRNRSCKQRVRGVTCGAHPFGSIGEGANYSTPAVTEGLPQGGDLVAVLGRVLAEFLVESWVGKELRDQGCIETLHDYGCGEHDREARWRLLVC